MFPLCTQAEVFLACWGRYNKVERSSRAHTVQSIINWPLNQFSALLFPKATFTPNRVSSSTSERFSSPVNKFFSCISSYIDGVASRQHNVVSGIRPHNRKSDQVNGSNNIITALFASWSDCRVYVIMSLVTAVRCWFTFLQLF